MKTEMQKRIEGHSQIAYELEICRKYGIDYRAQKGKWASAVERLHPKRLQLRVAAKIKETDTVSTLRLVAASGHLPVSYTHLDVYKRQRLMNANSPCGSYHLRMISLVLPGFGTNGSIQKA